MIVARLFNGDECQYHQLYVDGFYVACIWGIPRVDTPDNKGSIMVTFDATSKFAGFWHVDQVKHEPSCRDQLEAKELEL